MLYMVTIAKLIVFLLLAFPALSQSRKALLIPPRQSSSSAPVLPNGIQFRWIATNLVNPVLNWVDIVSGSWMSSSAGYEPKWTNGFGVNFDQTVPNYIEATNVIFSSGYALLVVCRPDLTNYTSSTPAIWSQTGAGTTMQGVRSNIWYYGNPATYYGIAEAGKMYDFISCCGGVGKPFAVGSVFTNGVLAITGKDISGQGVYRLGCGNDYWTGGIYEFVIWTNATDWAQSDVDAIHKYVTNTYSFSP